MSDIVLLDKLIIRRTWLKNEISVLRICHPGVDN